MPFTNAGTPVWIALRGTQGWSYQMVGLAESERKETGRATTYFATFRNNGPQWCYYNLQVRGAP